MDRNTEITLDHLHDAIVAATTAQFPDLATVEFYREDRKGLPMPACLLELTDMEAAPDFDPGTDQLAVLATFEAQLVIGFRQPGKSAKREIRKLAGAFAAWVRLQRWGCPVGPAQVVGAFPDDFEPELDQFECWRVEWQQIIHLGETVWTNDGTTPTAVFVSQVPLVGAAHADEYDQVTA